MICPKCGFEQPDNPECARCGVIVSRYKGPALGAEALRPPASPSPPPPSLPATAAVGGTVYEGPPPTAGGPAYSGTVYGGPPPGAPPPPSLGMLVDDIRVGDLLNQTFSIYFANFIPFALLTTIALSPLFIIQGLALSARSLSSTFSAMTILLSLLPLLLGAILCPQIATGAITFGVFQQMRRQETSIADCLGQGLSALPRVLGVAFVQGLGIAFGLFVCLVPGILLALRWAVAVPAAVTERTGVSESLERSSFLTEVFRGEVFFFLLVLEVLTFGLALLAGLAAAKNPMLKTLLSGLASIFSTGIMSTGSAVLYYRLRSVKESIDVDQIASVFA